MATQPNYLNQLINASVRMAFVVKPTVQAASYLLEGAQRVVSAGLKVINIEVKMPEKVPVDEAARKGKEFSYASQFYTKVHDYLPVAITNNNDAFKGMSGRDIASGFAFYTTMAIVSIFVSNKLIGIMPDAYNTVAKYAGSALRFDLNYDVIQLFINYVKGE